MVTSITKICSQCKQRKSTSELFRDVRNTLSDCLHSECKECTKAAKRLWALKNKRHIVLYGLKKYYANPEEIRKKNRERRRGKRYPAGVDKHAKQHAVFEKALRQGKLKRLPCEVCGNPNSQGHHPDYRRPLFVQWLCHLHHQEKHRKYVSTAKKLTQSVAAA